ncbi:MAG: YeeE/YedE family protein [Pseudomonadota bacterium]
MSLEAAWVNGLLGGLLIGSAAAIYMLGNGRIAGMSGILQKAFTDFSTDSGRHSALFMVAAFCSAGTIGLWLMPVSITVTHSVAALLVSGLTVGVGVAWGNGCTSGHGVCGLSRLSVRSLAATLTFMGGAAVAVFVIRHMLGWTL